MGTRHSVPGERLAAALALAEVTVQVDSESEAAPTVTPAAKAAGTAACRVPVGLGSSWSQ